MQVQVVNRGTLREIISRIDSFTDEYWICAENGPHWTCDSAAWVIRIPDFTDLRAIGPIPDYFLEIPTAREVLSDWLAPRPDRDPTVDEMCDVLIYFATHDGLSEKHLERS